MAERRTEKMNIPRDFYYSNVYPQDMNKATYTNRKVDFDLKPFSDYLYNSIGNLKQAAQVYADCVEVKTRLILKPRYTLLKIKSTDYVEVEKPKGNFYIIDWNEDWGDIESFEAIVQRRTTLCEQNDVIDMYDGNIMFSSNEEIDCSKKCKVQFSDNDKEYDCMLKKLNFAIVKDYRIEVGNAEVTSISVHMNLITIFFKGTTSNEVIFFDKIRQPVKNTFQMKLDGSKLKMKNVKVKPWTIDGYVVAHVEDENLESLYCDSKELLYEVVEKEDIVNFLKDKRVTFNDRKIEIRDNSIGMLGDILQINGLSFEVMSLGDKIRRKFKNKETQEYIGTIIELIEDTDFKNDVYSNTSYFFRETTDILKSDDGRRFKIGMKYENYNQLEIVEQASNGLISIIDIPTRLSIEPNTRQLQMQFNALKVLTNKPSKEHAPLLELMETKQYCKFGTCNYHMENILENGWYKLTDLTFEGCDTQREFVKKALATPDFAILEGPPGSGKTTTILEIIAQMIMRDQKVLLAASTNAAIDNILERIDTLPEIVKERLIAVRIGNDNAISDTVQDYKTNGLGVYRDEVMARANLVCGTIIGILQHPEFKLKDKSQPVIPLYDCLIIDEASKTTFQEFLVPAIYAKKWILSGDLKQLTPYVEQDNIEASLTQIPNFDIYHQKAQSYLMLLDKEVYRKKNDGINRVTFCILAENKVLNAVAKLSEDYVRKNIGILGEVDSENAVSMQEFMEGSPKSIYVYGSDILFIDKNIYKEVEKYLPSDFVVINNGSKDWTDYFNAVYHKKFECSGFNSKIKGIRELKEKVNNLFKDKTWAGEITWRLCRIQELFMLKDIENTENDITEKYQYDIDSRIPTYAKEDIYRSIDFIKEIALPSILQLLQNGINKKVVENINTTTLNGGFDKDILKKRHTLVEYQHRMHEDISAFSAKEIYKGEALYNGTIIDRVWKHAKYDKRAIWLNVETPKSCNNQNTYEVDRIKKEIEVFFEFAKNNPKESGEPWTIACLTYYRKQESELKTKLKKIFDDEKSKTFYKSKKNNIELMIYSIDKFQGKEADLVFLSMVKSGEVGLGFMDSPNRLNVALTRAKYQIVIVGDKNYFRSNKCKSKLLQKVAEEY